MPEPKVGKTSRLLLLTGQAVAQGIRISFHFLAAYRLGIESYGRFVVSFSAAVLVSAVIGLGIRNRMQYVLASSNAEPDRGVLVLGPVWPAIGGGALAIAAGLSGWTTLFFAAAMAIGLAGGDIAAETLKGEGRPTIGIMWSSLSVFLVPTMLLAADVIDTHRALAITMAISGITGVTAWTFRQLQHYGRPHTVGIRGILRNAPPLIATTLLMQASLQVPILFASVRSDEDAGLLALALRIVGVITVTAGTLGTPTIRATARLFWRESDFWSRYTADLRRLAPPTVLVAAVVALGLLNPVGWRVLASGDLRVIGGILLPGVLLGALTGPVTPTLFAMDRTRPVLRAAAIALAIVVAGGLAAAPLDNSSVIALSLSVAIATQNALQLGSIRSLRRIHRRG